MKQNVKIPIRVLNIEKLVEKVKDWDISDEDKKDIPSFLKDLEIGKVTGNIMKPGTLSTYIINLKIGLEFLKKPVKELKEKDIDKLCESLLKDKIHWSFKKKDKNGKTIHHKRPYTESTKIKIKDSLMKYLDWKLKEKAALFIKTLKVRPRTKDITPDFLREEQVEKLYKHCRTAEERFLIALLFDSGARAEEFHNIRFEDIDVREDKVRLTLKEEYSKTKGRTIGLYWKYSVEAVKDYLDERKNDDYQPSDMVFKKNYKSSRVFLHRLGKNVLNRSIHYHLFRHSSATYYASKLNRQQLCVRYGWKFRSPMPDRYIARDGLENQEIDEKFEKATINDLKEELIKVKQSSKMREDKLKQEMKDIMLKAKEELMEMLNKTGMIEVRN